MIDRYKVIDSLERCTNTLDLDLCDHCAYSNYTFPKCELALKLDALKLLKEQEIIGHWEEPEDDGIVSFNPAAYVQCSVCKQKACFGHKDRFCRHCGARMEVNEEAP